MDSTVNDLADVLDAFLLALPVVSFLAPTGLPTEAKISHID